MTPALFDNHIDAASAAAGAYPRAPPTPPPQPIAAAAGAAFADPDILYETKDVLTNPPVIFVIVASPAIIARIEHLRPDVVVLHVSDLDPSEGWRLRHTKAPLCICFTHAFGKCAGRNNNDPATCHQIHVKRDVLNTLRDNHPAYRNRERRLFFSRSVKAHLPPEVRAVVSDRLGRPLALHYLEFPVADVHPTAGFDVYEQQYRQWLTADPASFPNGRVAPFNSRTTLLCKNYSLCGTCADGERCGFIHAALRCAQSKDHAVAAAVASFATSPPDAAAATATVAAPPPQHSTRFPQPFFVRIPTPLPQMPATRMGEWASNVSPSLSFNVSSGAQTPQMYHVFQPPSLPPAHFQSTAYVAMASMKQQPQTRPVSPAPALALPPASMWSASGVAAAADGEDAERLRALQVTLEQLLTSPKPNDNDNQQQPQWHRGDS